MQEVNARVMRIDHTQFEVEVVTRSDELGDSTRWEREYCRDKYYHCVTDEERREAARLKSSSKRRAFVPRPINHPLFKNVSVGDAVAQLEARPDGSCIIRPSQKGTDRLQVCALPAAAAAHQGTAFLWSSQC